MGSPGHVITVAEDSFSCWNEVSASAHQMTPVTAIAFPDAESRSRNTHLSGGLLVDRITHTPSYATGTRATGAPHALLLAKSAPALQNTIGSDRYSNPSPGRIVNRRGCDGRKTGSDVFTYSKRSVGPYPVWLSFRGTGRPIIIHSSYVIVYVIQIQSHSSPWAVDLLFGGALPSPITAPPYCCASALRLNIDRHH